MWNLASRLLPTFSVFILCAIANTFAAATANAQTASEIAIPENASSQSYGKGWTCNSGFREAEDACKEIVPPEYAFLNDRAFGPGWDCLRGYKTSSDMRREIRDPANAY